MSEDAPAYGPMAYVYACLDCRTENRLDHSDLRPVRGQLLGAAWRCSECCAWAEIRVQMPNRELTVEKGSVPAEDQNAHYALALGKLFGNLGSLDVALRAALYATHPSPPGPVRNAQPFTSLNVGDQVEENWITKHCYLSELVSAYNTLQAELGRPQQTIDPGIVDLRNALAHGFVKAPAAGGILTLMKFGRGATPRSLQVTEKVNMTPEWMSEQMVRVRDALLKTRSSPMSDTASAVR